MKSDFKKLPRSLASNTLLAPFTTFNIGGPARFFAEVKSVEDVASALAFARANALQIFVLGGGSNVVISDNGFEGLALLMRISGITTEKNGERLLVTVGAGVVWDDFVVWTIERALSGLECMSGVPGTVGGAVVANVGAYGAQVSDTFIRAEVLDTQDESKKVRVMKKEECGFSYHDSIFGRSSGRYIIIRATFALSSDSTSAPSYKDNRFDMTALSAELGHKPTQTDVRNSVLKMREGKGSLIMKGKVSFKSAGSFFHMPLVSAEKYAEVVQLAQKLDAKKEKELRPWAWKQSDGSYKVAPGFLLEYTKFQKGYVQGGAGISPRHTLSIINVGSARASEVAELARDMQNEIEKLFGIKLEREVEYVGEVENKIL